MPRSSFLGRTFLARLVVILGFPFWFPRMVFWLFVEFFRAHLSDWFPAAFGGGQDEEGYLYGDQSFAPERGHSPPLVVLPGGARPLARSTTPDNRLTNRNAAGLRLIHSEPRHPVQPGASRSWKKIG